jgi:5-formyltetrahydrofolate cyclo-ligase
LIPTKKTLLRSERLHARRALSADHRQAASARIASTLIHSHEFAASRAIACYLPCDDEVDPRRVIARAWCAKKRVFAPVIDGRGGMIFRQISPDTRLERNYFGLWEPVTGALIAAPKIDLVLTPLVAFDTSRNRIGMGGGYFDRCFAFLRHRRSWLHPKLIGLAFDCQRVEKIQTNPWDIPLYRIVTESRVT